MAAFALQNVIQAIDYIHLDSAVAEADRDDAFLLDAVRSHTDSQTAIIYTYQDEASELTAVAARADIPTHVKDAGVTIGATMSNWIESLPGLVQGSPVGERYFEKFPEVLQYHLKRLAVIPLRAGDLLLGLLTVGRTDETGFNPVEIETAQRAARLVTAILERDSLRQKLAERKLVERAKGILQQRRKLTEEQAYLLLRNNSRRRRVPMATLAQEIIEAGFQREPVRGRLTA